MHVDLEHVLVADHQGAVALGVHERLQIVAIETLAEKQEARAVAKARLLDGVGRDAFDVARGAAAAMVAAVGGDRRRGGAARLGPEEPGHPAAQQHEQAVAAGIDDAGAA